jgi:hypothetical protein
MDIDYYYHPSVIHSFTKRLDLYSLGVVLFEIGRWELLTDAFPPNEKQKLADPEWSRSYLLKQGVDDLGWRMGAIYHEAVKALLTCNLPGDDVDSFAHEFFKRVIIPLEMCCA